MNNDLAVKIIGILLALVLALLARETRRMLNEVNKILRRQKIQREEMKDFVKTMFTLLGRLYPEKSEVISAEMQRFFLKDRGDEEDEGTITSWRQQSAG